MKEETEFFTSIDAILKIAELVERIATSEDGDKLAKNFATTARKFHIALLQKGYSTKESIQLTSAALTNFLSNNN